MRSRPVVVSLACTQARLRMRTGLMLMVSIASAMVLIGCQRGQAPDGADSGGGATRAERSPTDPTKWRGFANHPGPVLVGKPVKVSELTQSQRSYGLAPKRAPGITYQDDVIVMEQGDQAIRSLSADGMSWTLDAHAPGVEQIAVGKKLFATTLCAGEILAVQRDGDTVSVILGPVQLTDLIKEGNFAYDQPLDLNNVIALAEPDYPGAVNSTQMLQQQTPPAARTDGATPGRLPVSYNDSAPTMRHIDYFVVSDRGDWRPMRTIRRNSLTGGASAGLMTVGAAGALSAASAGSVPQLKGLPSAPTPQSTLAPVQMNDLTATPCGTGCGGIGLKLTQEKNGIKIKLSIVFHLVNPHMSFYAAIGRGHAIDAEVSLYGGTGVTVTIDGTADQSLQRIAANIHEIGLVPATLTIPIGGLVPLTAQLSQAINLNTGFSAKNSYLHGQGGISLSGGISMSVVDGHWDIPKPVAQLEQNLAGLVTGISIGINSVVFNLQQRLLVGVGALGFATGPYVELYSAYTALKQSSIETLRPCAQGTFSLQLGAGIGYGMPQVVANVINAVLSIFHVKPVPSWGALVKLPNLIQLFEHGDQIPQRCASP